MVLASAGTGRVVPRVLAPRLLLLSAVFIILSADVAVGRKCYWCGPLAEQVHRSRRAPPCEGAGRHFTVCEPGYDHCAVVATAPPYIESRFCVKLYQDECYPLFCNSTKTWKMTCACRGDLCNGEITEREEEAFHVLGRLVAQSRSHVKKRTPTLQLAGTRKGKVVNPDEEKEPIVDNSIDEVSEVQQNDTSTRKTDKQLAIESNQDSSPISDHTSTNQPIEIEKAESVSESRAEPTDAGITPNEGTSTIIQHTSAKVDSENANPLLTTSTVMIEIDIAQRPSNYNPSTQSPGQTMQEFDIQGDEPVQQHDQVDVDVSKHETEGKMPETVQNDPSVELDDNLDVNNLKPVTTDPVQKDASPPKPAQDSEEKAEVLTTSTMRPTTANTITTTMTLTKKSSSDKDKKSTALRLSVNTIFTIQCIVLSIVII